MNRAFKVIQGHPTLFRNFRRHSIRKTANSSTSTTPLLFDDSNMRNTFEYLEIVYIARNESRGPIFLPLKVWVYVSRFVTFHAIIYGSQTFWVKKCRPKTGFWHQIHSRSFILHSITGRQGVAYRHIILLAAGLISKVSEEVAIEIAKNCRWRQPHRHLTPHDEEPPRISAYRLPYISRN